MDPENKPHPEDQDRSVSETDFESYWRSVIENLTGEATPTPTSWVSTLTLETLEIFAREAWNAGKAQGLKIARQRRVAKPVPEKGPPAYKSDFLQISINQHKTLADAFPWINLDQEYKKMTAWLCANPTRWPKNHGRFAHNWVSRIPRPHVPIEEKPKPEPERETRDKWLRDMEEERREAEADERAGLDFDARYQKKLERIRAEVARKERR